MPRTWSRDSLPIVIKGDLRRMWGILAIVWAVALVPAGWWLLWHPESGSRALPLALIILVALPIGAAIDLRRRVYRIRFRVTEEGVAIESGTKVDFDRFAACSGFSIFVFALRWKTEIDSGLRDRGIGPGLGLSRDELWSLCALLNSLREQALAK
jgi:hypothetical protein